MAEKVAGLPAKGKTLLSGSGRTLSSTGQNPEGYVKAFNRTTVAYGANIPSQQKQTVCMLVRNVSGITLLPGRAVTWYTGKDNKQVGGYSRVQGEYCAGIVDDELTNGCPANDLFWLMIGGPGLIKTPLAQYTAITAGDILVGNTGTTAEATAATSGAAGRAQVAALTTTVTAIQTAQRNRLGRALSACSSQGYHQDVLVDLDILGQPN